MQDLIEEAKTKDAHRERTSSDMNLAMAGGAGFPDPFMLQTSKGNSHRRHGSVGGSFMNKSGKRQAAQMSDNGSMAFQSNRDSVFESEA